MRLLASESIVDHRLTAQIERVATGSWVGQLLLNRLALADDRDLALSFLL